jgi:hypothetical protein
MQSSILELHGTCSCTSEISCQRQKRQNKNLINLNAVDKVYENLNIVATIRIIETSHNLLQF